MKNVKKFGCYDYGSILRIWKILSKFAEKIEGNRIFIKILDNGYLCSDFNNMCTHIIKCLHKRAGMKNIGRAHIVNYSIETTKEYSDGYIVHNFISIKELIYILKILLLTTINKFAKPIEVGD